jgi:hypothetical protein
MTILKYIILFYSFTLPVYILAQKQADTIYNVEDMTEDFKYLHKHLLLNHPGIYKYTSKENWEYIYQNTLKKINTPLQNVKYRVILRE